jgi:hypothetical protein
MPCQLTPLKLMPVAESDDSLPTSFDALRLAAISTLAFMPLDGDTIKRLWAFVNPQGHRAMFVLIEHSSDKSITLHSRGDDKQLLLCLAGTNTSRNELISALQPGMKLFTQTVSI